MKHFAFEQHWDQIKAQLRQRFSQLTDDDLAFVAGQGEELLARLREKLSLSAEELTALLEELKAEVLSRVGQVKARAADLADEVRAKGAAAVEEVREQAGAAYEEARKYARTLREDGEDYVRHNPREALVGALCAGFVAGLLIRH